MVEGGGGLTSVNGRRHLVGNLGEFVQVSCEKGL